MEYQISFSYESKWVQDCVHTFVAQELLHPWCHQWTSKMNHRGNRFFKLLWVYQRMNENGREFEVGYVQHIAHSHYWFRSFVTAWWQGEAHSLICCWHWPPPSSASLKRVWQIPVVRASPTKVLFVMLLLNFNIWHKIMSPIGWYIWQYF